MSSLSFKDGTIISEDLTVIDVKNINESIFKLSRKTIVLIICDNKIQHLQTYIAAINSGHAVMLLPSTTNEELLKSIIVQYQPYWIQGIQDFNGYHKVGDFLQANQKSNQEIHSELAVLLSTSGTTGSQKFVRLSYENLRSNAESIIEYLTIDSSERAIMNLPLSYSYGLSIVNSHLLAGATLLLTNKSVMDKSFWEFVKEQKATSLPGVPFTYQMLQRIGLTKMDLPSLKTFTQAGGRLNEKLVKYFGEWALKNNKRFFVMYGQTEASPRISYIPFEKVLEKADTIGIAIPNGHLSIENEELIYKGKNVMLGYAECLSDLSKGDEMHGVLHTGDTATIDEDGYFTITGRMKRFIKLFGLRINLDEVEKKLESIFHIPLACTGSDDKLVIVIEKEQIKEELQRNVEGLYHLHKTAFKIIIMPIPHLPNGKVDYMKLKELTI